MKSKQILWTWLFLVACVPPTTEIKPGHTSSQKMSVIEDGSFEMIQVNEKIYVQRHNEHFNLILITKEGIVVVDPLNQEAAKQLIKELQRIAPKKKLAAIVYSHSHADHAGGAEVLQKAYQVTVPVIASKKAGEILSKQHGNTVLPPTELVDSYWERNFGDLRLVLQDVGKNHSEDMLVAWVPEAKLVYVVDFINKNHVGYRDLPGAFLPEFWDAIDKVLEWPIEIATFGHGSPGDKDSIEAQAKYWKTLRKTVREAIHAGLSEENSIQTLELPAYAHWSMYREWFPLNVKTVYRFEKQQYK